jgi:hypothetical protein
MGKNDIIHPLPVSIEIIYHAHTIADLGLRYVCKKHGKSKKKIRELLAGAVFPK